MQLNAKARLSIEVSPEANASPGQDVSFNGATILSGFTLQGTKTVVIPSDLTIHFEINRQTWSGTQEATFRIINLSAVTRELLAQDPYVIGVFRAIQFRAGYDGALPLCFNGYVRSCTSSRQGSDFVTEISAWDGGSSMANGFVSQTLEAGFSAQEIIIRLAKSLPGLLGAPIVGSFPTKSKRGRVLFGNTWQLILTESGGFAIIDNGQVKALGLDEVVDYPIPVISSESGLIGTPRRTPTSLEFETLFRPELTIGQLIQLESRTTKYYNGTYKVVGITHSGVISPVKGGTRRTIVKVFFGLEEFTKVTGMVLL